MYRSFPRTGEGRQTGGHNSLSSDRMKISRVRVYYSYRRLLVDDWNEFVGWARRIIPVALEKEQQVVEKVDWPREGARRVVRV